MSLPASARRPVSREDLNLPPLTRRSELLSPEQLERLDDATAFGMTPRQKAAHSVWSTVRLLVGGLLLWVGVRAVVVEAYRIPSPSMVPALLPGDVLFVNKWTFGHGIFGKTLPLQRRPERGDVVVFQSQQEPIMVVKRLIGLQGDTLEMINGRLRRNSEVLEESYVAPTNALVLRPDMDPSTKRSMSLWQSSALLDIPGKPGIKRTEPTPETWGPIVVPQGKAFVLGDNREESLDSRFWGFLPTSAIKGSPWRIYWSYDPDQGIFALRWDRMGQRVE